MSGDAAANSFHVTMRHPPAPPPGPNPSAVEPGGGEATAVVVAQVRPVVLERWVPDRDVGTRGYLNVVLLLGEVALDLVDDLAPALGISRAALADQQVVEDGVAHVAPVT